MTMQIQTKTILWGIYNETPLQENDQSELVVRAPASVSKGNSHCRRVAACCRIVTSVAYLRHMDGEAGCLPESALAAEDLPEHERQREDADISNDRPGRKEVECGMYG